MADETVPLAALAFDDANANRHTERGMRLLEKSLTELGAGRSVLLDRNNRVIAGNATLEAAAASGFEKVRIIETDGSELIAHRRLDVDLDTKQGRELALADNKVAEVNLNWDEKAILALNKEFDVDLVDWGFAAIDTETPMPPPEKEAAYREQFGVIVMCSDERDQQTIYEDLLAQGYSCKVVVT